MAQHLRKHIFLPGSVPSTYTGGSQLPVTPFSRNPMSFSPLGAPTFMYTYPHKEITIHITKNKI